MQVALDHVLEMWRSHEAVNRCLLAHTPDAGLDAVPLLKTGKPSKGRTIARNWAHIYESRVAHLRKREKQLMKGAPEFGKGYSPSRKEIEQALAQSSIGVEARLTNAADQCAGRRRADPQKAAAYLPGLSDRPRVAPPRADAAGAQAVRLRPLRGAALGHLGFVVQLIPRLM